MTFIKKSPFYYFNAILLFIAFSTGCKKENTQTTFEEIQVRYVQQICCGNLMITGNLEIKSDCQLYKDSLLRALNIEAFDIPQNHQFGDTFIIKYKLTEACEADCELTCNRMNGIPIELISVK